MRQYEMKMRGVIALPVLAAAGFLLRRLRRPGPRLPPSSSRPRWWNIEATGESARAMEESLQGTIKDLEQQMELYRQSKCEGAEADEGCADGQGGWGQVPGHADPHGQQAARRGGFGQGDAGQPGKEAADGLGRQMTPRRLQKLLGQGRPAPGPGPQPPRGGSARSSGSTTTWWRSSAGAAPHRGGLGHLPGYGSGVEPDRGDPGEPPGS